MAGVGADVSTFVVRMQDEVQPSDLIVRLGNAHHVCEIAAQIQHRVEGNRGVPLVLEAIDERSQFGKPRPQIEGVLQRRLPVIHLSQTGVVGLDVLGLSLHGQDSGREHRHRVGIDRHRPQSVEDVAWHARPSFDVGRQFRHVLFRRDISREEQIDVTFYVGHLLAGHLG